MYTFLSVIIIHKGYNLLIKLNSQNHSVSYC